jgi:hypothetical protein
METVGHSKINLTLNTYAHVLPALQSDAADKVDPEASGFQVSGAIGMPVPGHREHPWQGERRLGVQRHRS